MELAVGLAGFEIEGALFVYRAGRNPVILSAMRESEIASASAASAMASNPCNSVGKSAGDGIAVDQVDHRVRIARLEENYQMPCRALSPSWMSSFANDIAVDTVERFANRLKGRLNTEHAIRLLAETHCRPGRLRRFIRNARRSVRRRVRNAIAFAK
jgi:hypothetical protein